MNCNDADALVVRYADAEVHGLEKYLVERHLRECTKCAAKHASLLALRARMRAEVPYFAAPAGLRERIRAAVADTPPAGRRKGLRLHRLVERALGGAAALATGERLRLVGGGALAGCAATVLAFVLGTTLLDWRRDHDIAVEAVATHVRATLDGDSIQVASSDRHTVKPWLSARLDYSPPVMDLAVDGFPLLGGRLATLDGRPVATLVYRYRNHVIDVFVRPESSDAPPLRSLRGFNCAHANARGWDWLAVSDVSSDVLMAFVKQLAREAPSP
ncbi:MAG: anti-sigma factor family protein [Rudaea sp.]